VLPSCGGLDTFTAKAVIDHGHMWSRRDAHALRTGHRHPRHAGGNAASPTGQPSADPSASIVIESNVSPALSAANQTQVHLDAGQSQVSSLIQSAGHRECDPQPHPDHRYAPAR
jgi:hypothetical protein